jgi:hypothetical protein
MRHKTKPQLVMLKCLSILFCAAMLATNVRAEQEFVVRHSLSKQFVVYGPKASPIRHFKSERVPLDSALVAVSCERIKQALLGELEGTGRRQLNPQDQNEGKIYAVLHSKIGEPVVITPIPTSGSLNYRIDLPNEIEAPRLIDAVTETILLERANRNSSDRFTQIPRWLSQGLSAQVQAVAPETLVLEQHLPLTRVKARFDPIAEIRRNLTNFSALTFDELSWPETLSAEKSVNYRKSAQLLVGELLRLKNGEMCLRHMLDALPNHPRWQIAFMSGFEPHFKQLVDVEKWWELTVVNLMERTQILSHEQSIEQIDAALTVPVQIFHDFGGLPKRSNLTLQQIIFDWEPKRQKPAIEKVMSQLRILRSRVQPEIAPLLDEYRTTLGNYLQNGEREGLLRRVFSRSNLADLKQSTRSQLDSLDERRATVRGQSRPIPSTRAEAVLSALEVAGKSKQ